MPLSEAQQSIIDSEARFRVAVCGRRFGKTHLSMTAVAKVARNPNRKIFMVYPTYRQAKQTVWKPLKQRLERIRWIAKINESDLTIELVNGSTISLRGADNFDSLRGVGLDFIVLDEFAFIDEEAWTEVLRPTLSDRNGGALFISTPCGRGNWAFDLYQRGKEPEEHQWESWQYTTLDGGRVPAAEIEAARRDLDQKTFNQEYLATFEMFAGAIYYGFDPARNVKTWDRTRELTEILVMCDFNTNPMSACIGVQERDRIHIIDEIVIYGSNTDELVQEVRNRYHRARVKAYPDPAGVQRKTSAGGRTDITILENAGFRVFYHRQHPQVRDRINAVNSALAPAQGEPKLVIDPACRRVIECLTKQTYKEGTQIPDKDSGYDHMNDALGYGIQYLMPIVRDREPLPQPQTWRVQTA